MFSFPFNYVDYGFVNVIATIAVSAVCRAKHKVEWGALVSFSFFRFQSRFLSRCDMTVIVVDVCGGR